MKSIQKAAGYQFLVKIIENFSYTPMLAVVFALSMPVQAAGVSGPSSDVVVGEASLVLGKAYLLTPGEHRQAIKVGSKIRVSDQILTQANGHVHIRFIDQALVSVRPDSQLEIISYDFDPTRPEQSSIKFNLVEGVTRAISGKGAEAARSRFRLNTPIAAIGVRGTDFVVSATPETTRALVNQGAIVLAPYSPECTAAAFGPCSSNAVELTDNALQIIEFEDTELAPRLIPASHERKPGAMRQEVQLALADTDNIDIDQQDDSAVVTDAYSENVSSRRAREQITNDLDDFTPEALVSAELLSARQLVWGRWANAGNESSASERITLSHLDATAGRDITIWDSGYGLFRDEGAADVESALLGPVSFSLNSAQAFYNSDSGIVAMQVNRGSLEIDFGHNSFMTDLSLNHADTGFVDFRAGGILSENGYFNARSPTQRISGATSLDGREAGYFFEKQLEDGSINGLTLWDSN